VRTTRWAVTVVSQQAMPTKIPERLVWAVETLAVDAADRILEIGCGTGVALSLICERAGVGRVTAIDRSSTAVRMARRRNRAHIAAGKVVIRTATLDAADFEGERFDKILAINVNAFWTKPAPNLDAVKRLLAPHGAVYLVYQPPSVSGARALASRLTQSLEGNGLSVRRVTFNEFERGSGLCVIAVQP
jgi:SAM-dependent methyltransferase